MVFEETRQDLHFVQDFRALRARIVEAIAHRRSAGQQRPDLLGMLMSVQSRDGAAMSDPQLTNEIMTVVVAGHETTASTLN